MMMTHDVRRFALTAHVTCPVGWLGAALAFLGIAIVGLTHHDAPTVRGVYLVMEPAAWFVLIPFAFASLLTGLVLSLGTPWACSGTIGWFLSFRSPSFPQSCS